MSKSIRALMAKTSNLEEMKEAMADYLLGANELSFVVTGANGAGDITTTGVAAGDVVRMVVDLTTPAAVLRSYYTAGTDKVTQAAGAGNLSAKKLLIVVADET